MIIKPGEKIPTDGIIVEGSSSLDESALTGESIPIDKTKGDEVIGATINKNGFLKVKATKVGQDTVLSQIITLVEEAKTGKAETGKNGRPGSKIFCSCYCDYCNWSISWMVFYRKCRANLFSFSVCIRYDYSLSLCSWTCYTCRL